LHPLVVEEGTTMSWVGVLVAVGLMVVVFVDAFESVLLPRRVTHSYRLARLYYRSGWVAWRAVARLFPQGRSRNGVLSVFGPLSLVGLLGIWAAVLIVAFALLHFALETTLKVQQVTDGSFATYVYFSGTTFFTLGYGDVVPTGLFGRALSVVEAGIGFGFLALVLSYLPVLYQAFSRREATISLLDARAGSPPTAAELLRRLAGSRDLAGVLPFLVEWERWSAELLESHLSFPLLSFYRSQHDNQSWVGTLTTILDTTAFLIAGADGPDGERVRYQARLTFAMARHAAVDLGLTFQTAPRPAGDRLTDANCERLCAALRAAGLPVREGAAVARAVGELRRMYEPVVNALAGFFQFVLPPWEPVTTPVDNWQTSAWLPRAPGLGGLPTADDLPHFD
jgi:hypothetical protein